MAAIRPPIENGLGKPTDPWDWSVEEVVAALCDSNSSVRKAHHSSSYPDEVALAAKIRELDVTGLALLKKVDENCLRNDFSIKSIGHIASLEELIEVLQLESAKYQAREAHRSSSIAARSTVGWASRVAAPYSTTSFQSGPAPRIPLPWQSPYDANSGGPSPTPECGNYQNIQSNIRPRDLLTEIPLPPQHYGPIPQLPAHLKESITSRLNEYEVKVGIEHDNCTSDRVIATPGSIDVSNLTTQQDCSIENQGQTIVIDEYGRKRKRLVPTLVSALASAAGSSKLPTEGTFAGGTQDSHYALPVHTEKHENPDAPIESLCALSHSPRPILAHIPEHISGNNELESFKEPILLEPGVAYVDVTGRKRLIPILEHVSEYRPDQQNIYGAVSKNTCTKESVQSHPISSMNATSSLKVVTFGRKVHRRKDQVYLGLESFGIDEIFYANTELEGVLCDSDQTSNDSFTFIYPNESSTGQRLYVHARMKHFLRAIPFRLYPEGQNNFGVVPYPNRIGRKHYPLSMTLFAKDPRNNIIARRSNRSKYFNNDLVHAQNASNSDKAADIFHVADPSLAVDDVDDRDWKALEKWNYIDGHEEVLPVYGDSGSEGEYDMETWKEMEEEVGNLEKTEAQSRKPPLNDSLIIEAIDSAMEGLVQEWQDKKLPKLQMKAWRIWARAERSKVRQYQVHQLEEAIKNLEHRIGTLRNEIAAEHWSNCDKLMRQCKIMQPSVYDIETQKWERGILQLSKPPPKVPSHPKKPKLAPIPAVEETTLAEGEEDLLTEAYDTDITEDSLNNFIVDDDEHQAEMANDILLDDEPTMADIEGEEGDLVSDTLVFDSNLTATNGLDSSPLKAESAPTTPQKHHGARLIQPKLETIDLTQLSSDVESVIVGTKTNGPTTVKTPPIDNSNDEEIWLPPKAVFKTPAAVPRREDSVIDLDKSSDDSEFATPPCTFKREKPEFSDVREIQSLDPKQLVEQQDRKRLLIWIIAHTPQHQRDLAINLLTKESMEVVQNNVCLALKALKSHRTQLRGLEPARSNSVMQVAAWYISWTIPVKYNPSGLHPKHVNTTLAEILEFETFYDFLLICMKPYEKTVKPEISTLSIFSDPSPFVTHQKPKQEIVRELEKSALKPSYRKRVYTVQESSETLAKRRSARERLERDEERCRQRRLEELQTYLTSTNADGVSAEIILNPGKLDDQEYIRLDPGFGNGRVLKQHQVEGLRFLWREIAADADDLQGCLLAHTMGLGKTVQVIALLVALAGASQSSEESIRQQVPPSLQESQTLILCPPALVENWWEELHMWLPLNRNDTVGRVRTVTTARLLSHRVREISKWQAEGGILLMPYSTFADLIMNEKSKKEIRPLEEHDHQIVKTALLKHTKLVIADEAHEFKNPSTRLSKCVNQISTKSRIAMTGSPLSNNLFEYYSLIDWVSPKFLGTPTEFRATYQEPIHEGLFRDCSNEAFREALKRLKALQLEIEPKVHRADFSVLHSALHGKWEFVIRLPLGEIQGRLYRIFVNITRQSIADGEPQTAVLWTWLKLMQLLCFHPKVYQHKLQSLETKLKAHPEKKLTIQADGAGGRSSTPSPERSHTSSDDDDDDDDEAIATQPKSQSTLQRIIGESQTYLCGLNQDLTNISLSYKMQTLAHIVQLSIEAKNKILIFSHRRPTLDFIATYLKSNDQTFDRIDGRVQPQKRQAITKSFNDGPINICLVSTRAGGVGLNLYGANRLIILDEWFNPMYEQQAIGRSYRIGQKNPVYVYRLTVAGTFEQILQNQGLYKEQLAERVIDKKNPIRSATKSAGQYIFEPKLVKHESLDECMGKDKSVLDLVLANHSE